MLLASIAQISFAATFDAAYAAVPAPPTVTSSDYPNDDAWHEGVGRYGEFVIDDPGTDAVRYQIEFLGELPFTKDTVDGAPVTVTYLPTRAGVYFLTAQSIAADGTRSDRTTYVFHVTDGAPAKAYWQLDEPRGATTLQAVTRAGEPAIAATPLGGAVLGASGHPGTALKLNGTSGYAATGGPVLDTTRSYSVSAWVRPSSAPAGAVVLSQAGARRSEFRLLAAAGHWAFEKTPSDDPAVTQARVVAPEQFQLGEWAHLVGTYDATAGVIRLYVNGRVKGEASFPTTPWNAQGPLRIGAGSRGGDPAGFFPGTIDEVRVYDRILVAPEAEELSREAPVLRARWKLNEATPSPATTPDDTGHGNTLTLADGAHVDGSAGLFGTPPGALVLDGAGDYAATNGPLVSTTGSFTIAGWVTTAGRPSANAAVFSQAGRVNSGFVLRYAPGAFGGAGGYQFEMPTGDTIGAPRQTAEHPSFQSAIEWDHVAIVYDAQHDEMRLYVNGNPDVNGSIRPGALGFDARGGFQIGRAKSDGVWGEYWPGAIDDVWVYSGALSQEAIQGLGGLGEELPTPGDGTGG